MASNTLKIHTHMKKVGCTSGFPFGVYWWTLKNPKNRSFEKMKKIAGDIIILYMYTKNHNHMRYSSWDKQWDRIICHFGPFFALLHSLPNNIENQNFQKMKKASGDVIILNFCNKKHSHMMCAYSDMESNRQFFVISAHFLLFCPTIDPKN